MAIINESVELDKYSVAHGKITITSKSDIRNAVRKSTNTNVVIMCNFGLMVQKFM